MNKIISIFIKDENYELTMIIKKVAEDEKEEAEKLIKELRFENPFKIRRTGSKIDTTKLYFQPNYREYCPV